MTRTRHTPEFLASNVIRTNRFDTDRERRAKMQDEYRKGLADLNAAPMEQLEVTRGPDPIGDDVSTMMKWAGIIVGALVFSIFLYAWIVGDQPANLGVM